MHRYLSLITLMMVWLLHSVIAVAQTCPAETIYSTYIGGSLAEEGAAMVVDDMGRAYIAGTTFSSTFPLMHRRASQQHGVDAISLRLDPLGQTADAVEWVNPLSENEEDYGRAIGLDAAGNWYVAGETRSADFCATIASTGFDTTYNGNGDGFIYKQNRDGLILYCTYIGGADLDIIRDMVVLPDGRVTVTGGTWSADFPRTNSSHKVMADARDAFILQVAADGETINYSQLLGGSGQESGLKIVDDAAGNMWITGWSYSTDLPVVNAVDSMANGNVDAYVAQLSADGSTWQQLSYLGGSGEDRAYAIEINADGDVIVAGRTTSDDFPTTVDAISTDYQGGYDGFVSVISANSLAYSTYMGGDGFDQINAIATDEGIVWVVGTTGSADFPVTTNTTLAGLEDGFVTTLTFDQPTLLDSYYIGGNGQDQVSDIVARGNDIYLVGQTSSDDFCTTPNARDRFHHGDYDMFVTRVEKAATPLSIMLITHQTDMMFDWQSLLLTLIFFMLVITTIMLLLSRYPTKIKMVRHLCAKTKFSGHV